MGSVAKGTVLVVDDDPVIVKLLEVNFVMDGYTVLTANDGEEGLARALSEQPDVIVLDVMMPGVNGLDVARSLREREETSHIPIILLSAKAQANDVAAGREVADEYITKPFDPLELLDRVATLSSRARARSKRTRRRPTTFDSSDEPDTIAVAMPTMRDVLSEAILAVLRDLGVEPTTADVHLERPARREHGDWSTNIALTTAKAVGRQPRQLANELAERLRAHPPQHVERVEVAGPGFINFFLDDRWLYDVLRDVVQSGEEGYARPNLGQGERIQVEFVSANPTGPIHVGNGWWASYGDAVARLLDRCGWDVSREYYVNDTGGQIRRLGGSILARRAGTPLPEGGYGAAFVKGLAAAYEGPDDEAAAGRWAAERILGYIKLQMDQVNIHFDEWFSQASIEESEAVDETVELLRQRGLVFEEDGALWLRTADFGDPRERRVLRRSDGDWTYLAGDIAYHRNKFLIRGFSRVIDVWGADHQGQVASLKAGVAALGIDPDRLEIRLGQMISLASGRMSKRAGNAIDLDDLADDIGPDAMRLLSLVASIDQSTTIDLDKVRAESKENPVFYVQMAYARIAGIGREQAKRDVIRRPLEKVDLDLLVHERELDVLRSLSELPEVIEQATLERAPHKLTTWVRELADRFHGFYHDCWVLHPDIPDDLSQARLWLVEAAKVGFAIGLNLLGVAAPEKM
jgi:arginyl-tRNA synthetase